MPRNNGKESRVGEGGLGEDIPIPVLHEQDTSIFVVAKGDLPAVGERSPSANIVDKSRKQ